MLNNEFDQLIEEISRPVVDDGSCDGCFWNTSGHWNDPKRPCPKCSQETNLYISPVEHGREEAEMTREDQVQTCLEPIVRGDDMTDEQIKALADECGIDPVGYDRCIAFARAIESARGD